VLSPFHSTLSLISFGENNGMHEATCERNLGTLLWV